MDDSKKTEKGRVAEVRTWRSRKAKLERVSHDITEHRQAEEELKHSKEFIANVLNALDDPVFVKDEQHRWVTLNDAACEVMGHSKEELIGKTDYTLFPKEQADVFWERDNVVLETGQTDVNEEEITWHGKLHTISTKKSVFTDSATGKRFIAGSIRDITERKKAEGALRESEEKFRTFMETASDLMYITDKVGNLTYVNNAIVKTLGYSKDEIIGMHLTKVLGQKEAKKYFERKLQELITREEIDVESVWLTKDGKEIYGQTKVVAVYDRDGNFEGGRGILHDITERKRAEEETIKAKAQIENYLKVAGVMLAATDEKENITIMNDMGYEILGYKEGELIGKNWFDTLVPEKIRKEIRDIYNQLMSGDVKPVEYYENPLLTKDGEEKIIAFHNTVLRNPDNKIVGVVFSGEDITERKRAEEALQESEEKFRTIFDNTTDGILLADIENKKFLDSNKMFCQMLGYSLEEIKNIGVMDIHPEEDLPYVIEQFEKQSQKEITLAIDIPVKKKDGSVFYADINSAPITLAGKTYLMGVFRDITERKKTEEKLLDYQRQLKALASQLTLAEEHERYRIATELHDRIAQSLVVSKLRLETVRDSDSSADLAKVLNETAKSIEQIIQDVRLLMFELSSPILNELGFEDAVAEWLTEQIDKKHDIATEFEDDGQPKSLDDDVLAVLFRDVRELLVNAVKHAHATKIKVSVRRVNEQICVSVEDNGVGLNPAKTLSMAVRTGRFGLFSIREQLEELGGHLEIKSTPGHGTKITVTAPLKQEK